MNTDGESKVVAAGWGTYLNAALSLNGSTDDFKKSFWRNIPFGRVPEVVVWCVVNRMISHFFQSIHLAK